MPLTVNLLASLQHCVNGLVECNLGLVKFLLNLQDRVSLRRILILVEITLEFGHGDGRRAGSPGRAGVSREKLVHDLGEQLICHGSACNHFDSWERLRTGYKSGVLMIGNRNAASNLVSFHFISSKRLSLTLPRSGHSCETSIPPAQRPVCYLLAGAYGWGNRAVLPLSRRGSLGHRL